MVISVLFTKKKNSVLHLFMDFHAPELLVLYAQSWDTATPSIANLVIPCCHGHRRHPWLFSPVAAPHSRSRCTHHGQRAECPSKRQRQAPGPASSHVLESSGVPVSRAGGLLCPAPVCFIPPPPPCRNQLPLAFCAQGVLRWTSRHSAQRRGELCTDRIARERPPALLCSYLAWG